MEEIKEPKKELDTTKKDLAFEMYKVRLFRKVQDFKMRLYLDWTIDELKNTGNTIVYAPNASGKTLIANHMSETNYYYHNGFIEYIENDENDYVTIRDKHKKFSFNKRIPYHKIFDGNERAVTLRHLIAKSQKWHTNKCHILSSVLLKSLNKEIAISALNNINLQKIKHINEDNINKENESIEEQHFMIQHIRLNNYFYSIFKEIGMKSNKFSDVDNIEEEVDWSNFNGDGKYYHEIIEKFGDNTSLTHTLYLMICFAVNAQDACFQLIKNDDDFVLIEEEIIASFKSNAKNNFHANTTQMQYKNDEETLSNISKHLKSIGIIDADVEIIKGGCNGFIFMRKNKNITSDIFSRNSEGQNNLMSLVFFMNMINDHEKKIIMDDPFDSLDLKNTYEVCRFLKTNKMTKIIFTHNINYVNMLSVYMPVKQQKDEKNKCSKGTAWNVLFMKSRVKTKPVQLLDVPGRIKKEYNENYIKEKYNSGVLLLCRHIMEDVWSSHNRAELVNKLIYGNPSVETINISVNIWLEKYENKFHKGVDSNLYKKLIHSYDRLAYIKKYIYDKYGKEDWKSDVNAFNENEGDLLLSKYSKIYYFMNDMSHNNEWGYCIWDVLSHEDEINDVIVQILIDRKNKI